MLSRLISRFFVLVLLLNVSISAAQADAVTDYCHASASRFPYLGEALVAQNTLRIGGILLEYGAADWNALEPTRVELIRASIDELFDALAQPARLTDVMIEGHVSNFEINVASGAVCPIYASSQAELIQGQHVRVVDEIVGAVLLEMETFRLSQVPHRLKSNLLKTLEFLSQGRLDPKFKKPITEADVQRVLSHARARVSEASLSLEQMLNIPAEDWAKTSEEEKLLAIQAGSASIALRIADGLGDVFSEYSDISRIATAPEYPSGTTCNPIDEEHLAILSAKVKQGMDAQFEAAFQLQQQAALGEIAE